MKEEKENSQINIVASNWAIIDGEFIEFSEKGGTR